MAKLNKEDMMELRRFCKSNCEYSGTKEVIEEIISDILAEFGCDYTRSDEIIISNSDYTIEDFAIKFWDLAATCILNVVETQE